MEALAAAYGASVATVHPICCWEILPPTDYGNKFGEPLVAGYTRTYGQRLPSGERREWIKPIMFSGGLGQVRTRLCKHQPLALMGSFPPGCCCSYSQAAMCNRRLTTIICTRTTLSWACWWSRLEVCGGDVLMQVGKYTAEMLLYQTTAKAGVRSPRRPCLPHRHGRRRRILGALWLQLG